MGLTQVIENTWECDGLDCPTPIDTASENNPFTLVKLHRGTPTVPGIEIYLCSVCVNTLTAPAAVTYIAEAQMF